jgi:hypothetical protein
MENRKYIVGFSGIDMSVGKEKPLFESIDKLDAWYFAADYNKGKEKDKMVKVYYDYR